MFKEKDVRRLKEHSLKSITDDKFTRKKSFKIIANCFGINCAEVVQ